jgi:hypothetical protein
MTGNNMTTKYHLTLVSKPRPHEYCIISKGPWGKGKLIGEFDTTDEAYSAAMDLMNEFLQKNHYHLLLCKAVDEYEAAYVEVFAPDQLDDVA